MENFIHFVIDAKFFVGYLVGHTLLSVAFLIYHKHHVRVLQEMMSPLKEDMKAVRAQTEVVKSRLSGSHRWSGKVAEA